MRQNIFDKNVHSGHPSVAAALRPFPAQTQPRFAKVVKKTVFSNLLDNHVCCLFSLIVRCIFHTNKTAWISLRDWLIGFLNSDWPRFNPLFASNHVDDFYKGNCQRSLIMICIYRFGVLKKVTISKVLRLKKLAKLVCKTRAI